MPRTESPEERKYNKATNQIGATTTTKTTTTTTTTYETRIISFKRVDRGHGALVTGRWVAVFVLTSEKHKVFD